MYNTTKCKIFRILLLIVSAVILVSCKDNFEITIKNNTLSLVEISTDLINENLSIAPNEVKQLHITINASKFTITIKKDKFIKKYIYHDNDHWFSVDHIIEIQIYDEEIKINGKRNESFYEEAQ